eukprot:m.96136 g.96136  ORF g.96136 m.96136 type:complete len:57 (+) comp15177_c0_seq5:219-389(+)
MFSSFFVCVSSQVKSAFRTTGTAGTAAGGASCFGASTVVAASPASAPPSAAIGDDQ